MLTLLIMSLYNSVIYLNLDYINIVVIQKLESIGCVF